MLTKKEQAAQLHCFKCCLLAEAVSCFGKTHPMTYLSDLDQMTPNNCAHWLRS